MRGDGRKEWRIQFDRPNLQPVRDARVVTRSGARLDRLVSLHWISTRHDGRIDLEHAHKTARKDLRARRAAAPSAGGNTRAWALTSQFRSRRPPHFSARFTPITPMWNSTSRRSRHCLSAPLSRSATILHAGRELLQPVQLQRLYQLASALYAEHPDAARWLRC